MSNVDPSTSSSEPQSKKAKTAKLDVDSLEYDELSLLSEESYMDITSESEEESTLDRNESYVELWLDDCTPHSRPKIKFDETTGLNYVPENVTPLSFFNIFFSDSFLEFLARETNTQAQRVLSVISRGRRSRINDWKDTNPDEMRVFLGLLFLMGIIRINRINDYWRKHPLFDLPFSKYMGRDRYLSILRCLRFDHERTSTDMIDKIRPLVTYFNDTMLQFYKPSKELIVNESVVLWRGQVHKSGVKLYLLAEPNGTIQKFHAHGRSVDKRMRRSDQLTEVVSKLLEGREGKGHSVYMDSSYTSVSLVRDLVSNKIYSTGTLEASRKGTPETVVNADLKKGELRYKYTTEGICCCKWREKRDILCISSEYGIKMLETRNRNGEVVRKPELIAYYQKFMKGVDRLDQTTSYPVSRRTLCWYKKVGIHIMYTMLSNARILYNKYSNAKKNLYDFQLDIVMNLLPRQQEINLKRIDNIGIGSVHLPETLPKDKNNKTMRKRCKYCMESTKKRKDTIFYCPSCSDRPGLCLKPCFRIFHKYE